MTEVGTTLFNTVSIVDDPFSDFLVVQEVASHVISEGINDSPKTMKSTLFNLAIPVLTVTDMAQETMVSASIFVAGSGIWTLLIPARLIVHA